MKHLLGKFCGFWCSFWKATGTFQNLHVAGTKAIQKKLERLILKAEEMKHLDYANNGGVRPKRNQP
jgi:hypothetical protein